MKACIQLIEAVLGRPTSTLERKAILHRFHLAPPLSKSTLVDRLVTLGAILACPILLLRLTPACGKPWIQEFSRHDYFEVRKKYLAKFRRTDPPVKMNGFKPYGTLSAKGLGRAISLYFLSIRTALRLLADPSRTSANWLPVLLVYLWSLHLSKPTVVAGFQTYTPLGYMAALIADSKETGTERYFSMSDTTMFAFGRYTSLPNSTLILCNTVQQHEFFRLSEKGWVRAKGASLWGFEYEETPTLPQNESPRFDIGIYSSGLWGRNGSWRLLPGQLKLLRDYRNPAYDNFVELLMWVAAFAKAENKTVKVYFHPYEKLLSTQYKIPPPYISLLDDLGFYYDFAEAGKSVERIYEVEFGISLMSTVIWQRWSIGLHGALCGKKLFDHTVFEPSICGPYNAFFYHNEEDLLEILSRHFA